MSNFEYLFWFFQLRLPEETTTNIQIWNVQTQNRWPTRWDAYKFKLTINYFITSGEENYKGKRTIPGTNVELTSVHKPQKIWTKSWEKTLGESKLFSKMIEELLKGAVKTSGWLQLDLILYGPRTILNSFGIRNFFG